MRVVATVGVWVCVWSVAAADICDRRDRRTERRWKGDIGELRNMPDGARDSLQPHHRVRRFLSFPTGSVLTVTPKLNIPWLDEIDGYITGEQLYAFPMDLILPNGTLRFRAREEEEEEMMDEEMKEESEEMKEESEEMKEGEETTTMGYDYGGYDYYGGYSNYHNDYYNSHSRFGRAIDQQRVTGFTFLQHLMDAAGVEGQECVLRAVCEVAERPVEHLGLIGELINLFFSAGYGAGSSEVKEYVAAEEAGRRQGDCESLYPACPYHLAGMAQSALAYFHQGLATAGDAPANTPF